MKKYTKYQENFVGLVDAKEAFERSSLSNHQIKIKYPYLTDEEITFDIEKAIEKQRDHIYYSCKRISSKQFSILKAKGYKVEITNYTELLSIHISWNK